MLQNTRRANACRAVYLRVPSQFDSRSNSGFSCTKKRYLWMALDQPRANASVCESLLTCRRKIQAHFPDSRLKGVERTARHPGREGQPLLPCAQLQPHLWAEDVQRHLQTASGVPCTIQRHVIEQELQKCHHNTRLGCIQVQHAIVVDNGSHIVGPDRSNNSHARVLTCS